MVEGSIRRDGSFYIPDFIEIQKKSFFQFLEVGIIKEFQRMGPILAGAGEIEILFYPNRFILTPPDYTIREAILQGKTYESKLFVPAKMVSKGGTERVTEWVLVGSIPLMTRRGHFIINGSPRVIVNQMVRSPGIYFHRRIVGGKRRREVHYADVIPMAGSWLRLQQKQGEQLYAHLKRTPKIPYQLLHAGMVAFEEETCYEKSVSSLVWRYRARLALHLLDRCVSNALLVGELRKIKKRILELRRERVDLTISDKVAPRDLAEQLFKKTIEAESIKGIESLITPRSKEKATPLSFLKTSEAKEVVVVEQRLDEATKDALPIDHGGLAAASSSVTQERAEPVEGLEEEAWLAGDWKKALPPNVATREWLEERLKSDSLGRSRGEKGEESRVPRGWRWGPLEGKTIPALTRRKVVTGGLKRGRWREMVLNEIASSLGLVGRRSTAPTRGKVDGPSRLIKPGDPAALSNLFVNEEGRRDTLTEITSLLFLRASPGGWQRGRAFLYQRFKNPANYTLGQLGRARIEKKLEDPGVGFLLSCASTQLMARDLELARHYMRRVKAKKVLVDDIDHLKNRRVKTCGELLENQFRVGLDRLKTLLRFKVSRGEESISLKRVIDAKGLDAAWREFFGSNPLSQYMDQTNPLAEITHKRRVSCLGPGGVSRETAGMAMRGIHPSHYGRICPIETPEGKNAGLVNSLSSYTWVGPEGVLETPYYHLKEGQIQRRRGFHFFSAQREEEEKASIAPADVVSSRCNLLPAAPLPVRRGENLLDNFGQAAREGIQYVAMSRIQMISIATSLIPFLEHNDANRALMGSNMQRQSVPLLTVEQPIVATGLEGRVVAESGHILEARGAGRICYVSGRKILVQRRKKGVEGREWTPRLSPTSLGGGSPSDGRITFPTASRAIFDPSASRKLRESTAPSLLPKGAYSIEQPTQSNRPDSFVLQRGLTKYAILRWGMRRSRLEVSRGERDAPVCHDSYPLHAFEQSNQKTSLCQRPWVHEGEWVQPGDLLADCASSRGGQLCLGRNVVIAYLPWDGYNFEDAVVVSDRLLSQDLYTSLHIERYETRLEELEIESEVITITNDNIHLSPADAASLDEDGVVRIGRWVETNDLLVSKVMLIEQPPLSGYERLAYEILRRKPPKTRDVSLRLPKWVEGRVIDVEKGFQKRKGERDKLISVRLYVVERKKIQVGDKVAGRHGNKGIVSTILPREDMPYLPDGTTVDMVLNPLGVPSRMNVGQVFESLLGLAGGFLKQRFKITPFDEMYGSEASRSLVYLKLYQARLRTGHEWLFCPDFPGKTRLFDGRSGESFHQPVTVGRAYMLKLIHLVDEKIHARSRGPYSLITQQPVRGRARGGGQRLGEMEVWAFEAYGAAYTLQEILTTKSDDIESRRRVWHWIVEKPKRDGDGELPLGRSEGFKIVLGELHSLCLDVGLFGGAERAAGKMEITERVSPPTRQQRVTHGKVGGYVGRCTCSSTHAKVGRSFFGSDPTPPENFMLHENSSKNMAEGEKNWSENDLENHRKQFRRGKKIHERMANQPSVNEKRE